MPPTCGRPVREHVPHGGNGLPVQGGKGLAIARASGAVYPQPVTGGYAVTRAARRSPD